jgi:Leucine-rich repeat (LRR) protein
MDDLDVDLNRIHGTVPSCFANMTALQSLDLAANLMTGTLPAFLGNLTQLTFLNMQTNKFSGSIPPSWLQLTQLRNLRLHANHLTGTIPANFSGFTKMIEFGVTRNRMTGTLPASLFTAPVMAWVYVNLNQFTGSIPGEFADMTNIVQFATDQNHFSGPLPSLQGMHLLNSVAFSSNHFTGSLSEYVGQDCTALTYLQTQQNLVTGTIPSNIGNLVDMVVLFVFENMHTGTVPPTVSNLHSLTSFDVSNNHLTGTLPSLAAAPLLSQLGVCNNQLSGSLEGLLNVSAQPVLDVVVVNDNRFTGTLPVSFFGSKTLQVFVANVNCFHGSIPAEICHAQALSALVLDGLRSAKTCRSANVAGSYTVSKRVHGQIPHCLFQLPNVTSLHLSGNGLTGSFPSDLPVSRSLYDLTLSHNELTGSIPAEIQQRQWLTLDMSYNRFSGTLRSDFGTQDFNLSSILSRIRAAQRKAFLVFNETFLQYENITTPDVTFTPQVLLVDNRLSGKIPAAINALRDVSVLGTNLFSCKADGSDLPPADNGGDHYQCGSSAFDIPYYVWVSLASVFCVLSVLFAYRADALPAAFGGSMLVAKVRAWMDPSASLLEGCPGVQAFYALVGLACRCAAVVAVFAIAVLLPMYAILSVNFSEFTYAYAWTVSAAYLSGRVSTGLEMAAWTAFLIAAVYSVKRMIHYLWPQPTTQLTSDCAARTASFSYKSVLVSVTLVVVNLTVVVGVNVGYVYIAIYESSALLIFAQIMLSLFKLLWSSVCTSKQVQELTAPFVASADYVTLQVFVALLNNIVVPCCVVAVVSPNCFYNTLVPAPTVSSQYFFEECQSVNSDLQCNLYRPVRAETHFDPPFIYTYQCSSSIITYYAPAFVSLCVISSFIWPGAQLAAQHVFHRLQEGSRLHAVLRQVLSPALQPLAGASDRGDAVPHTVCNISRLVVLLVMYLSLLTTFGVVFPPLAACIALTIWCVSFFARAVVGRYVALATESRQAVLLDVIDADCGAIGSVPRLAHNALWMVVTISCWFYTLFLFDTLGDAVGFGGAYWVLVVMPLMPAVLYAFWATLPRALNGTQGSASGAASRGSKGAEEECGEERNSIVLSPLPVRRAEAV